MSTKIQQLVASSDSESDYDENEYKEVEEEECVKVKGLFCDEYFDNIQELFKNELKTNKFNLIDVVKRYNLEMIDYIKMINFIREKKPKPDVFQVDYKPSEIPWADEVFLKTSIEDDPALQFDVEEDLEILELTEINNNLVQPADDSVKHLQKKLRESEAKVEELEEIVAKLRGFANDLINKTNKQDDDETSGESDSEAETDSTYVNSYSNYQIHLEMLQDEVRTKGYMNAILDNKDVFQDKIVLDVGCGTGILSLFAAKAGARQVIAVDMSNILEQAKQIAKENGYENKIVFLKGKIEEIKLPVDKVDIIISEWMGYFLLFESMLDSVLYARDKYLDKENGIVLPNFFEMHLFALSDMEFYEKKLKFWSDIYGFKMSNMKQIVVKDAQIDTFKTDDVISDLFKFKDIDCQTCTLNDIGKFEAKFSLKINKDCELTGIGSSFDTYFNHASLKEKSYFSTSPFHTTTHWQQTLFQFDEPISVQKDQIVDGSILCYKNPDYLRSYIVVLNVFDRTFKYKVE